MGLLPASGLKCLLIPSLKRNYFAREREKNVKVLGGRVEGSWREGGMDAGLKKAEGSCILMESLPPPSYAPECQATFAKAQYARFVCVVLGAEGVDCGIQRRSWVDAGVHPGETEALPMEEGRTPDDKPPPGKSRYRKKRFRDL